MVDKLFTTRKENIITNCYGRVVVSASNISRAEENSVEKINAALQSIDRFFLTKNDSVVLKVQNQINVTDFPIIIEKSI